MQLRLEIYTVGIKLLYANCQNCPLTVDKQCCGVILYMSTNQSSRGGAVGSSQGS